ncbi:MAG: SDR family oxidoreductase [Nanoarchaeota archaeon]|nr:SDR family oxidoreductase [Nanoarchaeota archaeon]
MTVAIVTGGSGGIGLAIITKLLKNNIRVINFDKEKCRIKSPLIENIIADLRVGNINTLVESVFKKYKQIDILINSIGIYQISNLENFSEDELAMNIDINLAIPAQFCIYCARYMKKKNHGKIVIISSAAAYVGSRDVSYTISKAGAIGLVKSIARNLKSTNACIYGIAPGVIDTQMSQRMSEDRKNDYVKQTFQNRVAKPVEVAELVDYLIMKNTSYMSGHIFHINGGIYLN